MKNQINISKDILYHLPFIEMKIVTTVKYCYIPMKMEKNTDSTKCRQGYRANETVIYCQ